MENIKAFYTLALKYGFISVETYQRIILKISIGHENNKELMLSQTEEGLYGRETYCNRAGQSGHS